MNGATAADRAPSRTPPTGTVTFLFTDIEGSTALLDRLGTDRYESALARHRELIREALRLTGGVEIATEGDSFFVVFGSADAALQAAVNAQRRLQAEAWPAGDEVRVRMGLHTGTGALDRDGSYVGADVHRAARVGAAGNGGQVLLSSSTRALVGGEPLPGVRVRPLGEHRLKDLQPEPLFDLAIDGLMAAFGALRVATNSDRHAAEPAHDVHRSGGRDRGDRRPHQGRSPRDAHRSRRDRQDAPGHRGR